MTAAAVVATLEARGLRVAVDGADLVVRPPSAVTHEDIQTLKALKPEIITILRGRALGVDWSKVSLYRLDRILEVSVPWSDVPLLLAPESRIARELRAQDPKPGRVWCTCEVLDLLLSGVTSEDARRVAEAKLALAGAVVGARGEDR